MVSQINLSAGNLLAMNSAPAMVQAVIASRAGSGGLQTARPTLSDSGDGATPSNPDQAGFPAAPAPSASPSLQIPAGSRLELTQAATTSTESPITTAFSAILTELTDATPVTGNDADSTATAAPGPRPAKGQLPGGSSSSPAVSFPKRLLKAAVPAQGSTIDAPLANIIVPALPQPVALLRIPLPVAKSGGSESTRQTAGLHPATAGTSPEAVTIQPDDSMLHLRLRVPSEQTEQPMAPSAPAETSAPSPASAAADAVTSPAPTQPNETIQPEMMAPLEAAVMGAPQHNVAVSALPSLSRPQPEQATTIPAARLAMTRGLAVRTQMSSSPNARNVARETSPDVSQEPSQHKRAAHRQGEEADSVAGDLATDTAPGNATVPAHKANATSSEVATATSRRNSAAFVEEKSAAGIVSASGNAPPAAGSGQIVPVPGAPQPGSDLTSAQDKASALPTSQAPTPAAGAIDARSQSERPQSPMRSIALEFTPDGAHDVKLRLSERAGDVHISIHGNDAGLAGRVRDGVGDLIGSLAGAGYDAQAWTPDRRGQQQQPQPEQRKPNRRGSGGDTENFSGMLQQPLQEN